MKIIVGIKQVPAKDSTLRINETQSWIRDADISFEINEPDAYALEAALRLKEQHGGEVVALSAGPARVQTVLREALAKGADRAIHLEDDAFARLDPYNGARLLTQGLAGESFDLLLTGLQSDDFGYAQTGVILAELLGLPHGTIIMDVQPQANGRLRVKRELEAGWFQWVEMPMPAVLTIQSGLAKLRYATLMGIKKAKTKELKRIGKAELNWNDTEWAPTQQIRRVYVPVKTKQTQFLDGSAKEMAAKLVEKLKFEARVL
jgi:electron transfer flavoprotein beta subunit